MSKYEKLWQTIAKRSEESVTLRYDEIESILGFPIDHSFLTFKKELLEYGWQVWKISLKNKTVLFTKGKAE